MSRSAWIYKSAALGDLASDTNKLRGDLLGLGVLGATTVDRAVEGNYDDPDPARETARSGLDALGLATIAAPIGASALLSRGKARGDIFDTAAIGALTLPALDTAQAHAREWLGGEDAHKNMLLGHRAHAGLELAGLGALAGSTARHWGKGTRGPVATELAGYGALAVPYAMDLADEDGHGPWHGLPRAVTDVGGLAALGAGAYWGHRH